VSASEPFLATGCDVAYHEDGVHVRLTFIRDKGESQAIFLDRAGLSQLALALRKETLSGSIVPIDQASMTIGLNYRVVGHQVGFLPDRTIKLTVFLDLPDQGRTLSLSLALSADDVDAIARHSKPANQGNLHDGK
jgi:hypothetical protein